jgi:hypothetical protein
LCGAVQITVEPEQDADQGRHAEPNRDVEDVHSGTNLAPQMAIYSGLVWLYLSVRLLFRRHLRGKILVRL